MANQREVPIRDAPFLRALTGTILLVISVVLYTGVEVDDPAPAVLAVLFGAPGLYLFIAGAVASGVALARR